MDTYIYLSNSIRIKNPYLKGYFYQGPIEGYDFAHQYRNYHLISEKLLKCNKKLTTVYVGRYKAHKQNNYLTCFIAVSDDKKIAWYKYEGNRAGGCQNLIYVNGQKMKTTYFLSLNDEYIAQIVH
jgi:hypothetical protein